MALGGATADLVVRIVTETKDATKGMDAATSKMGKFKSGLSTAAKGAGIVLGGLTVAAVSFANAAAEDEQSQTLLANAMRNAAGAGKDQIAGMEDWISNASAASGVADDELRPAMSDLVRATGDATKAQKDMKTAMNIAAATGKPLGTVTKAIAKGYQGTTTSLGKLLPSLDKTTLASGDMAKIMKKAGDQTKGAMAESANTAAGRMARMNVAMNEAKESLGAALLPLMAKFATVMAQVGGFVQKHSKTFQILAVVIGAVAAAIIVLNTAVGVYESVMVVAGAVSGAAWLAALWPILLVIAAIAAVIAIVVVMYKKFKWFRDFVNAVWAGIKTAAKAVANFLVQVFQGAVDLIKGIWDGLQSAVQTVFDALEPIFKGAAKVFKTVWRVAKTIVTGYFKAWKAIIKTVIAAIKIVFRGAATVFKTVWRVAKTIVGGYFKAWKTVVVTVFNAIKTAIRTVTGVFKTVWREAVAAVKEIVRGFKTFLGDIWTGVKTAIGTVKTKIVSVFTTALQWITNKWEGLEDTLTAPWDALKGIIDDISDAISDMIGWIGKIHFPSMPGWLDKVMPGMAPAPPTPNTRGVGAVVPMARGARASGGGVTINVNGAIDPENTARQIKRILAGHDRRVGLRTA